MSCESTVTRIFGFAVRERDWPLAALLAALAGKDPGTSIGLRREIERSGYADFLSLATLRGLGRLLRAMARGGERRS